MPQKGFQPELVSDRRDNGRGFRIVDHDQLANRGRLTHFEIDDHLARLRLTLHQTPTENSIIQFFDFSQRGWNFVTGDGATADQDITITLPDAYHNDEYDLFVNVLGYIDGSDPSARADATNLVTEAFGNGRIIDNASFEVRIHATTGNLTNGRRFLFSWMTQGTRRGN